MNGRNSRKRAPRPMTRSRLQKAAVAYLQRFPSSTRHFRTIMQRKIERAEALCPSEEADYPRWMEELVTFCKDVGLLNDRTLAEAIIRSQNRRGMAMRQIRQRLRQKGFDAECIESGIQTLVANLEDSEGINSDLYAALRYAKRRRFGPFTRGESDWKTRQKQMASLARRGFSYETARRVIELPVDDPLVEQVIRSN